MIAVSAAPLYTAKSPPPPLVKLTKHPFGWVSNKVKLLLAGLLLAHIGMLIVTGSYYGLFETWAPITKLWHRLVSDGETRHLLRDVGEGFLGGFLAQAVIWNHYKRPVKSLNLLDRIEIALHIPNVKDDRRLSPWHFLVALPLVVIYAAPGFGVAILLTKWLHHTNHIHPLLTQTHLSPHAAGYWEKLRAIWTGSWPKKLTGYGASLCFGRRPAKAYFDDIQLLLVDRRIALGRPLRFYHPPTFQARYTDRLARAESLSGKIPAHHGLQTTLTTTAIFVGLCLAGFGYYVLTNLAH